MSHNMFRVSLDVPVLRRQDVRLRFWYLRFCHSFRLNRTRTKAWSYNSTFLGRKNNYTSPCTNKNKLKAFLPLKVSESPVGVDVQNLVLDSCRGWFPLSRWRPGRTNFPSFQLGSLAKDEFFKHWLINWTCITRCRINFLKFVVKIFH